MLRLLLPAPAPNWGQPRAAMLRLLLLLLAAAESAPGGPPSSALPPSALPSLLVCTPQPLGNGWADLDLLRSLHNGSWGGQRWNVDFTVSLAELNRTRIFRYNALVVFVSPASAALMDAKGVGVHLPAPPPALVREFTPAVADYVAAGGGLFLYPSEMNSGTQMLFDLTSLFGARLPVEVLHETNASNTACMNHMSRSFCLPIAYFDAVDPTAPKELTAGVRGCWLPTNPHYNAADTGPLAVDGNWSVVLRGSASTVTVPVNLTDPVYQPPPAEQIFVRQGGVRAPPLFAVRSFGRGRVALFNSWRQYTLGGGRKWLFDDQILRSGANGRPSDLGNLLTNTLRWLAEPSWRSGSGSSEVGGWTQPPGRLDPPNAAAAVRARYADVHHPGLADKASLARNPATGTYLGVRGIIGLRSSLSTGMDTVEEFAAAASLLPNSPIGFLVFLEKFEHLTPAGLEQLRSECKEHSTAKLQLIPGYSITNTLGNEMMFIGPGVPYPPRAPKSTLTADGKRLAIQPHDPANPNNFTGVGADIVGNWLLSAMDSAAKPDGGWNVGYFHLGKTRPPGSLPLINLIDSSLAATTYVNASGFVVEELTEDYLATAAGGIAPTPVVVSEVLDLAALKRAAIGPLTVARYEILTEV